MNTKTEAVATVYNKLGELVAIVKRDEKSKKNIVYVATEASVEEITNLITSKEPQV